jgi:hypothetical protein
MYNIIIIISLRLSFNFSLPSGFLYFQFNNLWWLHSTSEPSLQDSGVEAEGVPQERGKMRVDNSEDNTNRSQ